MFLERKGRAALHEKRKGGGKRKEERKGVCCFERFFLYKKKKKKKTPSEILGIMIPTGKHFYNIYIIFILVLRIKLLFTRRRDRRNERRKEEG